jgi:hypothetical protein
VSEQALAPQAPMTDDEVLDYTQLKRRQVVDHVTRDGFTNLDNEDMGLILKAVDGMDRTALTRKKIASDEKIADKDLQAAGVISTIFAKFGNKNPFERTVNPGAGAGAPTPDLSQLPAIETVPGENHIGQIDLTYDSFLASRGETPPEEQVE